MKYLVSFVISIIAVFLLYGCAANIEQTAAQTEKEGSTTAPAHTFDSEADIPQNTEIEVTTNGETTLDIETDAEKSAQSGAAPEIMLNSGYKMPVLGLGTYSLKGDECIDSIFSAIDAGYRLVDTAYMYENEKEVGEAVRQAIEEGKIDREDIFVTTKIYPTQYNDPKTAIDDALEALDIEYIDLMLLHHPGEGDVNAYLEMEKYLESGKIRSIGLSNYYIDELEEFLPNVNVTPALVQNEIHPYYQDLEVVPYIQDLGIAVEGWYPLGGRGHQSELLNDPTIKEIAQKYGKSVAQVILRWDYQRGIIAIPGSSNPDHILENISIFDFELTDEEMKRITELNRDEKHDWY